MTTSSRCTRLAIIVHSLGRGGAERTAAILSGELARVGMRVTVVTIAAASNEDYSLDGEVGRLALGMASASIGPLDGLARNLGRVRALREVIRQVGPDCVVSIGDTTNVLSLLACRNLVPCIVSERTSPDQHRIGAVWSRLRDATYPSAAALVLQTEAVSRWARRRWSGIRVAVIPNMLPSWTGCGDLGPRSLKVLALGRLEPVKRMAHVVEAFAVASRGLAGWRLEIGGDGSERGTLERLVQSHGVSSTASLRGHLSDPRAWLRSGEIFVLASEYEGFPNVLLEAMDAGLGCIAYDCPHGPREILADGSCGILVPTGDVAAMTGSLARLMRDAPGRVELSRRAIGAVENYRPGAVLDRWLGVIESVRAGDAK
jgi:GalNAc-alpha-(1->4)-GalNAc-alpha-(1->3)-diNAcBac-PP-undecaprenol alpha-1,4-N-acetyl-D-galactosaminyltransferase